MKMERLPNSDIIQIGDLGVYEAEGDALTSREPPVEKPNNTLAVGVVGILIGFVAGVAAKHFKLIK